MNGIFKTDNSANVVAPALVMQRSDFISVFSKFKSKLKIELSTLFFW